jgi:hypothetical protein
MIVLFDCFYLIFVLSNSNVYFCSEHTIPHQPWEHDHSVGLLVDTEKGLKNFSFFFFVLLLIVVFHKGCYSSFMTARKLVPCCI